jgi:di/tripeptidase
MMPSSSTDAFGKAAAGLTSSDGKAGGFGSQPAQTITRDTESTGLARAMAAGGRGRPDAVRVANGGLDANWMRHAMSTAAAGAGQNDAHTVDEWIGISANSTLLATCYRLATMR